MQYKNLYNVIKVKISPTHKKMSANPADIKIMHQLQVQEIVIIIFRALFGLAICPCDIGSFAFVTQHAHIAHKLLVIVGILFRQQL